MFYKPKKTADVAEGGAYDNRKITQMLIFFENFVILGAYCATNIIGSSF